MCLYIYMFSKKWIFEHFSGKNNNEEKRGWGPGHKNFFNWLCLFTGLPR